MSTPKILVFGGVLAFLGLLGFGLTTDPWELPAAMVGKKAPTFALEQLDGGEQVRLSDLQGKVVMVNFWASWCVPCIQEHGVLERAWREYSGRGVEVVGIPYRDSPGASRSFLQRYGGGWLQLQDPDTRTAIDFGVYGVPETFFIDRTGAIAHKEVGPLSDEVMVRELERLLAGASEASPEVRE
jgi:cytochrome c biogenesis protein CcmG/thiol:disulfide interchange protein DsbE